MTEVPGTLTERVAALEAAVAVLMDITRLQSARILKEEKERTAELTQELAGLIIQRAARK